MASILFYCQHLLGIGHLRRAATLANGLSEAGFSVAFVNGGPSVPHLMPRSARLVQLPPLRARDAQFSGLVDLDGQAVDDVWKRSRCEKLLSAFTSLRPDILLIEMFPFGRRQMRFELLPLLDIARTTQPKPLIVCSVRDVLSKPFSAKKSNWVLETATRYLDLILVHGDPDFLRFEESFPPISKLSDRLRYTGYVVTPTSNTNRIAKPNHAAVLVSAGGGAVGTTLLRTALGARARTSLRHSQWLFLTGDNFPEDAFEDLTEAAPNGVTVERSRPDFPDLLSTAELSISQAGYNTVMEVLQAACPAVVVPFAAGDEGEQRLRANLLARRGLLQVVEENDLNVDSLVQAADAAISQARPSVTLKMDGTKRTADILHQMISM